VVFAGRQIPAAAEPGWHDWDGHRFVPDRTRRVIVVMAAVVRGIYAEAAAADDADRRKALAQWAKTSESRQRIENALSLAEAQPEVADLLERYDTGPHLIGMPNGVYDLHRDEFRNGRREDRITFSVGVAYDPAATCPRWEQFQQEIHEGDADVVAFKQRAWGYTLSGDTSEQKLFICYGDGSNGKTSEQNVVFEILGDYARKVEPETLLHKERQGANNDIARLRGICFVGTEEVGDGKKLAENLVKQLTGRNRLTGGFSIKSTLSSRQPARFGLPPTTGRRSLVLSTQSGVALILFRTPCNSRVIGGIHI
jgi:putative DNA primase/helicase